MQYRGADPSCYTRPLNRLFPGRITFLTVLILLTIACGPQQDRSPAIGQAFVGPVSLNLRQDLSTKAPVSAVVHHGEPLDILEFKRRFIKARTAGGITGWTDIAQLMTPEQMADLRHLAEDAAKYPSQGTGTTFEVLNVHTIPSRNSPSFLQVPEGGKVDVIGHKVTPRVQAATTLTPPPPKPRQSRKKSKEKGSAKVPPPSMPPAPRPPTNWQDLSKTQAAPAETKPTPPPAAAPPAAPLPKDDWTLIRTKDHRVGWVLSRMVNMAIPDDVAQYAEGHRITSYFPIGDVQDEDQLKHNWLWTTIGKGPRDYEFDSVRFFIWSRRHHRYETAFIQRGVVGHYPVEVNNAGQNPAFSIIIDDDDGQLIRKTYTFNGYRVNRIDTVPYEAPPEPRQIAKLGLQAPTSEPSPQSGGWFGNLKERVAKFFKR